MPAPFRQKAFWISLAVNVTVLGVLNVIAWRNPQHHVYLCATIIAIAVVVVAWLILNYDRRKP